MSLFAAMPAHASARLLPLPPRRPTGWRRQRSDAANSGRAQSARLVGRVAWSLELPGTQRAGVVGDGDTVYVASDAGWVEAVDVGTRSVLWRTAVRAVETTSIMVGRGGVYVGGEAGDLVCLSARTGWRRWVFHTGDAVESCPVLDTGGRLYFGSDDYRIYCLDGATGRRSWSVRTGGRVFSSPALGAGAALYIGSADAMLYALDRANGAVKWRVDTQYGFRNWASPGVTGGPAAGALVYVSGATGYVLAVDPRSGRVRWSRRMGAAEIDGILNSPTLGGAGTVNVASEGGQVLCLAGRTGATRWRRRLKSGLKCELTAGSDGTLYAGCEDGALYALGQRTGQPRWRLRLPGPIGSDLALLNKRMLCLEAAGRLYFIR